MNKIIGRGREVDVFPRERWSKEKGMKEEWRGAMSVHQLHTRMEHSALQTGTDNNSYTVKINSNSSPEKPCLLFIPPASWSAEVKLNV